MRFADIRTGTVYSGKDGYDAMVVLDEHHLYDSPRFGSYIQSGGKHVMVLAHTGGTLHTERPDLLQAAEQVVIPEGRIKYSDISTPKGTILKFVTLSQIAGVQSEIAEQREVERRKMVESQRRIQEANHARDERVAVASGEIKELLNKERVHVYVNNIGTVQISLDLLEELIAKAKG